MYTGVFGLSSEVDGKFKEMQQVLGDQVELSKGLLEMSGQIDMLVRLGQVASRQWIGTTIDFQLIN